MMGSNECFRQPKVYNNVLECIGCTPMVKLNRIPKDHGLQCQVLAKCEYVNPGGSVKDRISHAMVVEAEKSGRVNSKSRLIEPTSGNTGIGISLTCAIRGYDCTIVTPDKNSSEKMSTMSLLGSDIIQTPSSAHYDDPDGFMTVVKRMLEKYPNAVCLDQYDNEINPLVHYEHTAEEIIYAAEHVDMFVMGVGTGGTLTGVARKLREHNPNCIIVAVDPKGSIIFGHGETVPFFVEGIGGDFVPDVLDKSLVNKVVATTDYQAFNMSRELIKKEGLLCGGSSGAITYAAIQTAKELNLGPDKKVVVILPDGIRNYMTKFVCDQWMEAYLFKQPPNREFKWFNKSISELKVNRLVPCINKDQTCMDALSVMDDRHNVTFVVDDDGYLKGVVTKDSLRSEATNPKYQDKLDFNSKVIKHLMKTYYKIANSYKSTVGLASRILDIAPFVVVVEERVNANNNITGTIPQGIITPEIVLDYILKNQN